MRKLFSLGVIFLCLTVSLQAQQSAPDWSAWNFVLGTWIGEGGGKPGEGAAEFSFTPDLQNRILVRRNHNVYPATKDRPAFTHDDLLIVYKDSTTKAVYFDNEGHVINYSVGVSDDGKMITFVSEPLPAAPRYRLRYSDDGNGGLKISFEIAQLGKPDAFKMYVEGTAQRK